MQVPTEPADTDRERTTGDAPEALEPDEVFRVLQSGRRRRVVRHLLEYVEEPVPVDALATAIARAEHDDPTEGLDAEVRDRVAISLDHAHLPALEAAGVVDHDRTRERVTATPAIEAFEPFLEPETASAGEEPSSLLALTGAGGAGLASLLAERKWTAAGVGAAALLALWAVGRVTASR